MRTLVGADADGNVGKCALRLSHTCQETKVISQAAGDGAIPMKGFCGFPWCNSTCRECALQSLVRWPRGSNTGDEASAHPTIPSSENPTVPADTTNENGKTSAGPERISRTGTAPDTGQFSPANPACRNRKHIRPWPEIPGSIDAPDLPFGLRDK